MQFVRTSKSVFLACYLLVTLIGVVDFFTGYEVDLSVLYLIPIYVATWRLGRRLGMMFALSSALVWLVADFGIARRNDLQSVIPYWNTTIKMALFSFVVLMTSSIKKGLERERKQKEELAQSNTALEQFAYAASHDLQSPLGKIISFIDLSANLSETDRAAYMERIKRMALRMRHLVEDLLTLAKVRTMKTNAESFEETDLNDVITEVISDLENEVTSSGAKISVVNLPIVRAVPHQLYRVFLNLLSNALKYRRENEPLMIEIFSEATGDKIKICIKDNGIGFEPTQKEKIFKPFQRLHGQSQFEGTGLGLAICDQIVRYHGGRISAESIPGHGSTFVVEVPVSKIAALT